MSANAAEISSRSRAFAALAGAIRMLDRVPYALLALPLRFAVATVFWNSGMTKLANWDTTIALFADEYQVPVLPPEPAANMAAGIELTTPVPLVLGLLTRLTALVLLGMTTVIRGFRLSASVADPYPMGRHAADPAPPRAGKFLARSMVATDL